MCIKLERSFEWVKHVRKSLFLSISLEIIRRECEWWAFYLIVSRFWRIIVNCTGEFKTHRVYRYTECIRLFKSILAQTTTTCPMRRVRTHSIVWKMKIIYSGLKIFNLIQYMDGYKRNFLPLSPAIRFLLQKLLPFLDANSEWVYLSFSPFYCFSVYLSLLFARMNDNYFASCKFLHVYTPGAIGFCSK